MHIYTVLNTHYYMMKGSFINEGKQRFGIIDVYFDKYSFYENAVLVLFLILFFIQFFCIIINSATEFHRTFLEGFGALVDMNDICKTF